jgi:hypothetical protein
MKVKGCCSVVCAILIGTEIPRIASAQGVEPACTVGINNFIIYRIPQMGNAAFSATAKTSYEQRLPDGNYVRGYVRTHEARDAAGRTMIEVAQSCRKGKNGVLQPDLHVTVLDPITKTSLYWPSGAGTDKVAHLFHTPSVQQRVDTPEELAVQNKAAQVQQPPQSEYQTEDLGSRTIAGLEVQGSRRTRTIAAGEEGNELPLVVTHESWRAQDLGLIVMAIDDDPRRGRTTFEIEELSRSEPESSTFAAPAGYTVVEPTSQTEQF